MGVGVDDEGEEPVGWTPETKPTRDQCARIGGGLTHERDGDATEMLRGEGRGVGK